MHPKNAKPDMMSRAELQVPVELGCLVEPLFPSLVSKGAGRVVVFSYARPGEPPYWLAFIFDGERRYGVGTLDLRRLPLRDQVANLLHQLENWRTPSPRSASMRPAERPTL